MAERHLIGEFPQRSLSVHRKLGGHILATQLPVLVERQCFSSGLWGDAFSMPHSQCLCRTYNCVGQLGPWWAVGQERERLSGTPNLHTVAQLLSCSCSFSCSWLTGGARSSARSERPTLVYTRRCCRSFETLLATAVCPGISTGVRNWCGDSCADQGSACGLSPYGQPLS